MTKTDQKFSDDVNASLRTKAGKELTKMTSSNTEGLTWPEQDAVDLWLKKHDIDVSVSDALDLKNAVSKLRIEGDIKIDGLQAEVERLEDENHRFVDGTMELATINFRLAAQLEGAKKILNDCERMASGCRYAIARNRQGVDVDEDLSNGTSLEIRVNTVGSMVRTFLAALEKQS